MVVAAAREIRDGEIVFVGMRLPLLGFAVAKELHAPRAIGIFENGVIRDWPAQEPFLTISDPPNLSQSLFCGGILDVMSLLQRGRVHLGFIGGAEIDRFGNLNTHWVREGDRSVRLPGSGGAADIATLAGRCIIIMNHERRRFRSIVQFMTTPGYGEGRGWREKRNLKGGGPSRVISSLGIFSFDKETCEMVLSSRHPGVTAELIQHETDWPLRVAKDLQETDPPTNDELAIVRRYDPRGVWTSR